MNFFQLLMFGLLGLLTAQELEEKVEAVIPQEAVRKALQWMQDENPQKREAAYRSFQIYGGEAREIYRATLERAQLAHGKRLARVLNDEGKNPYHGIDLLTEELKDERQRIYALIKIDYKKDGAKVRMLRDEVEKLDRLNNKLRKITLKDSKSFDDAISSLAMAMAEVQRELDSLDEEEPSEHVPSTVAAQQQALNESFDGEVYLKAKKDVQKVRAEVKALEATNQANADHKWANTGQKDFASIINTERSFFGLSPLLIEERLSAASVGHSKDMERLGFFAHESPVKAKKTPWDRARLAGFEHRAMGENIYLGSPSPQSAFNAWFASDGHRFIMFAKGPNLLGVGLQGRHWTMMTGRK